MNNSKKASPAVSPNSNESNSKLDGIIFDARWNGSHGIGRFAQEVSSRLKFKSQYTSKNNPAGLFSALELGFWSAKSKERAIFSPSYVPPLPTSLPFVFTIHDLNHIDVPHNSSLLKRIYYQLIILPAVKKSHKVLTVSEFSKKRIIDWSGCAPEKVIVVGNGVSSAFNDAVTPSKPGYSYLFCCSNRKGHKNEARLLEAFKTSKLHKTMKLVFTGKPDEATIKTIKLLELANSVIFTGQASESELASWYKGAIATVFPSLYEGFGLPLIESMACGTPVIASNTTSLPEVGGDAGYYIDPLNIESIAAGMTTVVHDESLQKSMRLKGLSRSKLFTWDRTAQLVEDALHNIS